MLPLEWDEKYNINVKEIDEQHKNLFVLFNKLQDGIKAAKSNEELGQALSDLIDHTILHFTTEEKLMQRISYVGFVEHKRLHDDLIADARDLQQKFTEGKITLSAKVSVFLTDWLTNHIVDADKKYAPLLK